ncbi:hypothetical protein NG798_05990 [Ancylothrix sp. C2]|nr:hypothetical protein [Ancylothrix sp. D3o]MCT7949331.1 hypothetical protein [Ancylothrix sp. D3o]
MAFSIGIASLFYSKVAPPALFAGVRLTGFQEASNGNFVEMINFCTGVQL